MKQSFLYTSIISALFSSTLFAGWAPNLKTAPQISSDSTSSSLKEKLKQHSAEEWLNLARNSYAKVKAESLADKLSILNWLRKLDTMPKMSSNELLQFKQEFISRCALFHRFREQVAALDALRTQSNEPQSKELREMILVINDLELQQLATVHTLIVRGIGLEADISQEVAFTSLDAVYELFVDELKIIEDDSNKSKFGIIYSAAQRMFLYAQTLYSSSNVDAEDREIIEAALNQFPAIFQRLENIINKKKR